MGGPAAAALAAAVFAAASVGVGNCFSLGSPAVGGAWVHGMDLAAGGRGGWGGAGVPPGRGGGRSGCRLFPPPRPCPRAEASGVACRSGGGGKSSPKRVALVTGGNRGLGRAVARELAREGLQVWLGARVREDGEEAARQIREEGLDAEAVQLDVGCDASVGALARRCLDRGGGMPVPDILVNNAGVCLLGSGRGAYGRSMQVNFFGALRMIRALAPAMARKGGCVVNVSSGEGELVYLCSRLQGLLPSIRTVGELCRAMDDCVDSAAAGEELAFGPTPSYSVSKAGLNALTRILAEEGAGGGGASGPLGVRAVCPGDVDTAMCAPTDRPNAVPPQVAAADVAWVAMHPEECENGGFFRAREAIPR